MSALSESPRVYVNLPANWSTMPPDQRRVWAEELLEKIRATTLPRPATAQGSATASDGEPGEPNVLRQAADQSPRTSPKLNRDDACGAPRAPNEA